MEVYSKYDIEGKWNLKIQNSNMEVYSNYDIEGKLKILNSNIEVYLNYDIKRKLKILNSNIDVHFIISKENWNSEFQHRSVLELWYRRKIENSNSYSTYDIEWTWKLKILNSNIEVYSNYDLEGKLKILNSNIECTRIMISRGNWKFWISTSNAFEFEFQHRSVLEL